MVKKKDISHFKILDWDFNREDSRIFIHNFCWYPSRFIPIIPAYLIQALSKPSDTVLDPFCGAGTTLVEAIKLNRNAIGIDLNPIGNFISETKIQVLLGKKVDIGKLRLIRDDLHGLYKHESFTDSLFQKNIFKNIPNYEINECWYHAETLAMLAYIYRHVESLSVGITQDIAKLFFISILMSSTGFNENKSYAYYADNVKPKGCLKFKNSFKLYYHKINNFIDEYLRVDFIKYDVKCKIYKDDARNLDKLVNSKVDLVVTSPPYLSVTDYTTGFRLAYLWYSFFKTEDEISLIKQKEIGARWKRKHTTSFNQYMEDMKSVIDKMAIVLKKNGHMCLVIGESKKYYNIIKNTLVDRIEKGTNFILVDSFDRNISKKFFIHPEGGGVQTEDILIFRKEGN